MHNLVPAPSSYTEKEGLFTFQDSAKIGFTGSKAAFDAAGLLAEYLASDAGLALPVCEGTGAISLVQTADAAPDEDGFLPEAYTLEIDRASGIKIESVSAAGLVRAIQTLRQLRRPDNSFEACFIKDEPAFRWRGLHLDVSRHFFRVDDVCRFIELLSQHRMNVFHWHLTDDQGWRIEIKRYPRLAEVGSVRARTLVGHHAKWPHKWDDTPHGGFYTQEDIRRVVAFAARRHVLVVPEIDMPGHMEAAIAAYPALGTGVFADVGVRDRWGISQNVLNLDDDCIEFCKGVWEEVFALFPGKFCHIGGDEAPRAAWEECAGSQRLMAERGLDAPRKMQSWFTARMSEYFRDCGKRIIGWDEILEGDELVSSAAVMYWRPWAKQIDIAAAAKAGHKIVCAPTSYTYLDYYQAEPVSEEPPGIGGLNTLPHVFSFDPLEGIAPEAHGAVLGGQGQLWTEYIATRDHLDYMTYPRACALAETLWSGAARRLPYADFRSRLSEHLKRLAAQGVRFCDHAV